MLSHVLSSTHALMLLSTLSTLVELHNSTLLHHMVLLKHHMVLLNST